MDIAISYLTERLRLTMSTPEKTNTVASIFCQVSVSMLTAMLTAIAMIGCTY